jgi:hypothetical protein
MGILVVDVTNFPNGLSLSNFVITVKGCIKEIVKQTISIDLNEVTIYRVWNIAYFYASQTAYNNSAQPFEQKMFTIDLNAAQLTDIFTHIYNNLKSIYPSGVDC